MSSEFEQLVEMHRQAANERDELANKLDRSETERKRDAARLHDAIREIDRLKADVGAAMHGRVKENPLQCNASAMPMERDGSNRRLVNPIPGLVMCPACTSQFEPGPGWFQNLSPQGKVAERS